MYRCKAKSFEMEFRCESELLNSPSLDVSDLTWSGCRAGVALAEGAGAQSTPRAQLEGCRGRMRLQPAHVCDSQCYLSPAPAQLHPVPSATATAACAHLPDPFHSPACRATLSLSENHRVPSICTPRLFIYLYDTFKN